MKIFHTYIKKYQFLTPERLYDEFVEYFENEFTEHDSTIYLIAKCKKPRWIGGSIKFLRDYKFAANIEIDGSAHGVTIDMGEFWYSMPHLQHSFPNKYAMANCLMSRSNRMLWRLLPKDLQYKYLSSIEGIEHEGKLLKINCELARNLNEEGNSLTDIFLYQAINHYDLPQPTIDIIYIGSSLRSTLSRLQKHEKWGWIQSQKGANEDILAYFFEIEGDQFQLSSPVTARDDHSLNGKDETLITEVALINYFKPKKYDDKHIQSDIKHYDRVKNNLIRMGFNQVCVEMLLKGNMAKLGSQHVPKYGEHTIYYDIA